MTVTPPSIAIIGGGPAGLIAAEKLAAAGCRVTVYERKPSFARKFLMAGRGGLNLTHSETLDDFLPRYGAASLWLTDIIRGFTPDDLRAWCEGLGEATFVGSSGRVFPSSMKASPLLRAWQKRLQERGVTLRTQWHWQGWHDDGALVFVDAAGATQQVRADAVLLAMGGASWAKLGSDGHWAPVLAARGVKLSPFAPANSGFTVAWSPYFSGKFAGSPLKPLALTFAGRRVQGEAMLSATGIEGGAVYALSALLRDSLATGNKTVLTLDLNPALPLATLTARLARPRQAKSFSNVVRTAASLSPQAAALLHEGGDGIDPRQLDAAALAQRIKALPLTLTGTAPLDRAISTAGGICLDGLDDNLMLKAIPGVFAAGEMLDWEAPTGGYLLQATFATGVAAADGMLRWLKDNQAT